MVLLAGCGSDDAVRDSSAVPVPTDARCFSGNISGAGSSAQENAMQTWVAGYQTACEDTQVFYDSIGSGGGRSQFIDGAVSFAGSDTPLDPEENAEAAPRCEGSDAVNIPAYVVPIAVVFHLPGVDSLNLTPQTIARIFNQEITHWNDPAIAESNPDTDLPDMRIAPVSRSDDSGTTENFSAYLKEAAGESWPHDVNDKWPLPPVEAAQGNSGVAEAVENGRGTIGYVENSHVGSMSTVNVGVGEEFVGISPEAAARIVSDSPKREGGNKHDHALELDYGTTSAGTYPIVLVSYEIACLDYSDADQARRLTSFLSYVISDEGQAAASQEAGSAPLPDDIQSDLQSTLEAISGS
ncbi:phosphate ABC transporter substrate-binding protein PstS [Haloactinospora alba]|nr:phosphate ABC transporter substrate-binding protein PstS [Haloactinospora alba]